MNKIWINNCIFEYEVTGKDEPIFVILSGYGESIESWDKVRPKIELHGKVFVYNRCGIGGSSKATSGQCGKTVVSDLRDILKKLDIAPPYILVGHSIGGLYANLYGRLYPNEVSAAVLIEPTHPDHEARLKNYKPPLHVRVVNSCFDIIENLFSRNKYTEWKSFQKTVQQVNSSGSFPNIPLSVIVGNKKMPFEPNGLRKLHLGNQQEMASMSCKGKLVIAKNSGHFPQISQPELVSNVVIQLLNDNRNSVIGA